MGVGFLDRDRDGEFDLFVTDMHSDMTRGQTMAALRMDTRREKGKSEAFRSIEWTEEYLQGSADNAFHHNRGEGEFIEISDRINVET